MGEKSYAETVGKKKKEQPKGGTEQGHEKSEPGKKEKKKKKRCNEVTHQLAEICNRHGHCFVLMKGSL